METENHEYYVSPEIANLLEKAGFDWRCRKCYNKGVLFDMESDEIREQCPQHSSYDVLAPTLEVAQRWLREVKGFEVTIDWSVIVNGKIVDFNGRGYNFHVESDNSADGSDDKFPSYEQAQEAGIKKALEIMLEKEDK